MNMTLAQGESRDSSVSTVTTLWDSRSGSDSLQGATASRPALRPIQTPIQCLLGALSLGAKLPRHKAHDSPQSSVEFKNAWKYTSTPSIRLYGFVSTGTSLTFYSSRRRQDSPVSALSYDTLERLMESLTAKWRTDETIIWFFLIEFPSSIC
jgi:hypothetical protein